MRDNSNDRTVERNYIQKWRFLIREYELVKAKKHTRFRFVQDFYNFHGTNRQTFAKYYNRYRQTGADEALLPLKRGPKWKSRRTLPFIEERVLEQRPKVSTAEICHTQADAEVPYPFTFHHICHNQAPRSQVDQRDAERRIIKTRAGELGHRLSRDLVLGARQRYLVSIVDACTRLAWAEVVDDLKSLSVMFAALKCINMLNAEYGVRFEAVHRQRP